MSLMFVSTIAFYYILYIFLGLPVLGFILLRTKKRKILLLLFLPIFLPIIYLFWNWIHIPFNPKYRNKINFNIPIKDIEDSLKVVENLIVKLPIASNSYSSYKLIDSNKIKFSDGNLISFQKNNNVNLYKLKTFENFSKEEIERFLKLTVFLDKNNLSGSFYRKSEEDFIFDYNVYKSDNKYVREYEYDLARYIYYYPGHSYNKLAYRELDMKGNLFLLTYIDSRNW